MTKKEYDEISADPKNVKAAFNKAMVDRVGELGPARRGEARRRPA